MPLYRTGAACSSHFECTPSPRWTPASTAVFTRRRRRNARGGRPLQRGFHSRGREPDALQPLLRRAPAARRARPHRRTCCRVGFTLSRVDRAHPATPVRCGAPASGGARPAQPELSRPRAPSTAARTAAAAFQRPLLEGFSSEMWHSGTRACGTLPPVRLRRRTLTAPRTSASAPGRAPRRAWRASCSASEPIQDPFATGTSTASTPSVADRLVALPRGSP
jgi:hypothetical protein